jgi:hypothetical protein
MSSWYYRSLSLNIGVDYYRHALLHVLNFYCCVLWVNIGIDSRAVAIYYYRLIPVWIIIVSRYSTCISFIIAHEYYVLISVSTVELLLSIIIDHIGVDYCQLAPLHEPSTYYQCRLLSPCAAPRPLSSCLILSADEAVIMRIAAVWVCCFVAVSHLFLPQPDKQDWKSHVRGHPHPVESLRMYLTRHIASAKCEASACFLIAYDCHG